MLIITSDSIDELNQLYRQLKHNYLAVGKIQLNTESLQYQMRLEKKNLNPVIKNLSEKTYEWCEYVFTSNELKSLDDLFQILENHSKIPFISQLLGQLHEMSVLHQKQVLEYFKELGETQVDLSSL
jgi:hypothetical protein